MTKPGRKKSMGDFMREVHRVPFKAYQLPADRAQRAEELCHARRDLLLLLATYANTDGTSVRPAIEPTLTSERGWSKRTVYRRLADLQSLGFIRETGKDEDTGIREWSIDLAVLSHESRTGETKPCHESRTGDTDTVSRVDLPVSRVDLPVSRVPLQRHATLSRPQVEVTTITAAVSQEQMEREVQEAWNYYLEKFDKQESISPSAKKVGVAVLTALRRRHPAITSEQCMDAMTGAIDRARYLVKRQPAKEFFAKWHAIFGKFETFYSLWEECHEVR